MFAIALSFYQLIKHIITSFYRHVLVCKPLNGVFEVDTEHSLYIEEFLRCTVFKGKLIISIPVGEEFFYSFYFYECIVLYKEIFVALKKKQDNDTLIYCDPLLCGLHF